MSSRLGMPSLDYWALDEDSRVEAWRLHRLIEAGYPARLADELARRGDVDLHFACELVATRGCAPERAVEILT